MTRPKSSLVATWAVLFVAGAVLLRLALLTSEKVDHNRAVIVIMLQNYGEPIDVSAVDNLGRPTMTTLTESNMTTRWERIQSAVSEYREAAVQVLKDTF